MSADGDKLAGLFKHDEQGMALTLHKEISRRLSIEVKHLIVRDPGHHERIPLGEFS